MSEALAGKVVAVAGATGTLGRVATREFARDGAALALLGTSNDRLSDLAAELNLPRERTLLCAADLRDGDAAARAVTAILERFGRIDVLVLAVGGWTGGSPIAGTPAADLGSMLDQHVWTTFNLLTSAVPPMSEAGWGRIVAVSAPAAVDAPARSVPYAAAKAAQEAIVRSVAHELEGTGVTANLIVVRAIEAAASNERPATATGNGPHGRRASTTPVEIVEAIRYLCSDSAAAINGARLPLYGG